MSGYYIPNINIDANNKKSKKDIQEVIKKDLGENAKIVSSKKYIYADNENQSLVFIVLGYSASKSKEYIIDANSGEIIINTDILDYATAYEFTGNGISGQ